MALSLKDISRTHRFSASVWGRLANLFASARRTWRFLQCRIDGGREVMRQRLSDRYLSLTRFPRSRGNALNRLSSRYRASSDGMSQKPSGSWRMWFSDRSRANKLAMREMESGIVESLLLVSETDLT
eukprot:3278523-Rhodomonas_salina.1